MNNTGTLYIIAVPIGNYEDITIRALETIREKADIIYCEDTRQTGHLLSHFGIKKTLRSLHAHSDDRKITALIDELNSGKNIAYMTDCGTPGLSDPGSKIVSAVRNADLPIVPLPGVSALTTIISVSGFPEKSVIFGGFLSKKPGKRINELTKLREFDGIIVIYESPHRIEKTLTDISLVFPGNDIVIGREMTKTYEEFLSTRGTDIPLLLETLKQKGEFAISINNSKNSAKKSCRDE